MPIAFKGRLIQCVGRVLRPHPSETTAEVHDHHDIATGVLASSLPKRAPGYISLRFPDPRTQIDQLLNRAAATVRHLELSLRRSWCLGWVHVGRKLGSTLSDLLAMTDVRLTRLDVDHLLDEVLERVRVILEADTAAVLLRQHDDDDYLVARAACGLEDEVRQGVRVPIGTGFAGTVAAHQKPVILDRVDPTTVANPVLWEKGILRMVGVPCSSARISLA